MTDRVVEREADAYIDVDVHHNPARYRGVDGIVTNCIAYALYDHVPPGNWRLIVNFGNHGIIRSNSCAWVSVCEYDISKSEPIVRNAFPQIFDVVCQTDRIVVRVNTNVETCLKLNIMVKRVQDYIPQTVFGKV